LKVFIAIACGLAMLLPPPVLADDGAVISEIVVTSQRRPQSRLGHAGNIDQLDAATLQRMQHHHISELLHRILEDGIPVRPASFCNINQLIEVNAEQARSVEVVRGPGNALFGSNALHGIINVIMPNPGEAGLASASVELGSNDFVRARASLPFAEDSPWLAAMACIPGPRRGWRLSGRFGISARKTARQAPLVVGRQ
jgi:outer membrane cobalamin receptor